MEKINFFIYNKKVNIDETEINLELENILRKKIMKTLIINYLNL